MLASGLFIDRELVNYIMVQWRSRPLSKYPSRSLGNDLASVAGNDLESLKGNDLASLEGNDLHSNPLTKFPTTPWTVARGYPPIFEAKDSEAGANLITYLLKGATILNFCMQSSYEY